MHSHLDYGGDYDYSNDEIPYVIIYSINPQSLEMAVQRLESITDKEIDDRKEIWDNQQEIEREKYREAKLEEYVQNRQTPYFENEFCSCYKADIIPQNISPYVVNPNNQLTKMFTISTPENNYIYEI